jgi:hypothetical protein
MFGVMVLAVTDRRRPEEFWCAALGYEVHTDGFGGSAGVLIPPIGTGTMIALQTSEMPPKAPQQPTTLTGRPPRRPPGSTRHDLDHGAACVATVDGFVMAKAAIESSLTAVQS